MLDLQRPLVYISIESTGLDVDSDRVVELAMIKVHPSGQVEFYQQESTRINPGVPIPPEAVAVHGITQAMLRGCPRFAALSKKLHAFMDGCDLAGYNVRRFVVPMLTAEFERCGMEFPAPGTKVVDLMRIFHKHEPRDLAGAVQFFLNRPHKEEHGALEDAVAAVEVLAEMVVRYDLPRDVSALEGHACGDDATLDGKLQWRKSEDGRDLIVFGFGKHKGKTLKWVAANEPGYISWMLQRFPPDTCAILEKAAAGRLHDVRRPRVRKQQAQSKPTTHSATRLLTVANTLAGRAGEQLGELLQKQQRSYRPASLPAELLEQVSQLTGLANKLQLAVGGAGMATQAVGAGPSSSRALAFPATPQQVALQQAGNILDSPLSPGSSDELDMMFASRTYQPGQGLELNCHTAVLSFGRHKGTRLLDVARQHPSYLEWMMATDFPPDVLQLVSDAQAAVAGSSLSQLRPPRADILKDDKE